MAARRFLVPLVLVRVQVPQRTTSTGVLVVLIDLLAMAGYVGLVARSRRRLRPEPLTAALDLRPPSPWGVPGPPVSIGYGVTRRREAQHGPWGMG